MSFDDSTKRALGNIATFGDTDVFPFLFERHIFFDRPDESRKLLQEVHDNFDTWLNNRPPSTYESLAQVGYTGFRWATQIEPWWNAYYLALVISLADQIETIRIPADERTVFSYRYAWSEAENKLFADSTWNDYRRRCIELAEGAAFIVLTDISDFYSRVYHHRLENQLNRLPAAGDIPKRIMALLTAFSRNVSYGLPIGGPASRILSELALNSVDKQLRSRRIAFCRYADDYCVFCGSKPEAYKVLVLLSEQLFNEGLVLQKSKTRILSASEFYETCKMLDPKVEPITDEEKLLNISIRFDPYSETAVENYEALSAAVHNVNVVGILAREIGKTAIDQTVTKQAIHAIRALDTSSRAGAIRTLLDKENVDVLSPVFVTMMRAVRTLYDDLSNDSKTAIDEAMVRIFDEHQHILSVELNLAYYLQAISKRYSNRKEEILVDVYDKRPSPIVRRIVIGAMSNWECDYWLSDMKRQYSSLDAWLKPAMILASYYLTDEGKHWRDYVKKSWDPMETLTRDWFCQRFQTHKDFPT
jgi:hypothetical protein